MKRAAIVHRWLARVDRLRAGWGLLTFYQRFEQVVALALTFMISIVIVLALLDLVREVARLVLNDPLQPLSHATFQRLFGQIMTLLIALEFKHSILKVVARQESIIQVKTILLIAMLALARKFIILDTGEMSAQTILALAGVILALGISYWLLRERDDRLRQRHDIEPVRPLATAGKRAS